MTTPAVYRATFQRQPDGRWIAEVPEVPGVYGAGRTLDEARQAVRQALECFAEGPEAVEIVEEISW